MSIFSLNQNIFEETHIENTQLQSDLSNLQFQFLTSENNLSLSETSEIIEDIEINSLENKIWTKEEITKFELLYYKTKDILEKQEDDQKLEEEISLLQDNDFEELFKKNCCEKNCLQSNCDYSVALARNLNFRNLAKSFQDMYLLGIIAATKRPEITRNNSKKSKLTTEYVFEGKSICFNAFKIIYGIGDRR